MNSNPAPLILTLAAVLSLSLLPLISASGIEIEVEEGNQVVIESELRNPNDEIQNFVYIVQIEHEIGYVEFLSFRDGIMAANEQLSVGIIWNPETEGTYTAKSFLISSFESPMLLSDLIQQTRISVDGEDVAVCSGSANCFIDTVTRVIDGDTLDVGDIRIRLALTNTPELNEVGYDDAKDFTSALCPVGSRVLIDQDDIQLEDDFGRMLAKVTCGNAVLNSELLEEGHANILTEYCEESEFSMEEWAQEYGCGVEEQEQEVDDTPAPSPTPSPSPAPEPEPEEEECHPSYPSVCIPPPPPDLDCSEIPYTDFTVLEPDPHRFDGDNDGIGCET